MFVMRKSNKSKTVNMTNQEKKEIAKAYYLSVSNNDVLNARMSSKYKGHVTLTVYNRIMKSKGTILVVIRPEFDQISIATEIGIHCSAKLSLFKTKSDALEAFRAGKLAFNS